MSNSKTDKFDKPDRFDVFMRVSLFFMDRAAMFLIIYCVPNYLRHRHSSQYLQCRTNCIDIGRALQLYADDNDGKYPRSLTSLTPGYLKDIPVCGSIGINGAYIHSYRVSRDLKAYTFYCEGLNHVNCGIGENYPQYSSGNGLVAK